MLILLAEILLKKKTAIFYYTNITPLIFQAEENKWSAASLCSWPVYVVVLVIQRNDAKLKNRDP